MNIQLRQQAEKSIVKALAKECFTLANSQGTCIYVECEGHSEACENPTQVWNAVSELDECYVHVMNIFTGKTLCSFLIVLGNDGYDCIADQSFNDFGDKVDKALQPLFDKWEKKLC